MSEINSPNVIEFSVIIPAYNSASYISSTLNSILNQIYPAKEIIVVNDGSNDNTAEVVRTNYPDIILINQQHSGAASARNLGIFNAKSKYIAFIDSDDIWLPTHLENAFKFFNQNPESNWYTSSFLIKKPDKEAIPVLLKSKQETMNYFKASLNKTFMNSSTVIIRKDVFNSTGVFCPYWSFGEDLNMWFRIALIFPNIGYSKLPGALIHMRPDSMTREPRNLKLKTTLKVLFHTDRLINPEIRPEAVKLMNNWFDNAIFSAALKNDKLIISYLWSRYRKRINFIASFIAVFYCILPYTVIKFLKYFNSVIKKVKYKFR